MRKRIGVFASRLAHDRPRGVHRVARRIAEYLAEHGNPAEFEFLCLTKRIKNQSELTFKACALSRWLAHNPLSTAPAGTARRSRSRFRDALRRFKRGTKRILVPYVPHLLRPFCYFLYRALITMLAGWLAILPTLLRALHAGRQGGKARPVPTYAVTLNELDAVVSFENHEEIWRLPVENHSCKSIGWFYDVITLRVADEARRHLDHLQKALSTFVLRADRIVCGSYSAEEDLCTFFPHARGKTCVIYDGHDAERFQSAADVKELVKLLVERGINPGVPYVIAIGGIEPRKNTINMLRACIHLRKRRPDLAFQLVLVGEAHALPGFHLQAERARRHLPVIHTGYLSDNEVARLVAGARALLYPSLWEGFGIPQLEAMSAGVLVISSNVGSMPEVCGEHAFLCDPYEPDEISAAIGRCLEMPSSERQERVEKAREYAARFTWDRMGEQVVQLLRSELVGQAVSDGGSRVSAPKASHEVRVPRTRRLPHEGAALSPGLPSFPREGG